MRTSGALATNVPTAMRGEYDVDDVDDVDDLTDRMPPVDLDVPPPSVTRRPRATLPPPLPVRQRAGSAMPPPIPPEPLRERPWPPSSSELRDSEPAGTNISAEAALSDEPDELAWLEQDAVGDVDDATPVRRRSLFLWSAAVGVCAGALAGVAFVTLDGRDRAKADTFDRTGSANVPPLTSSSSVSSVPAALPAQTVGTPSNTTEVPAVATPASVGPSLTRDVRIASQPPGATLTVVTNGVPSVVGTTPVNVTIDPAQRYEVVLALTGYPTKVAPLRADVQQLVLELAPRRRRGGERAAAARVAKRSEGTLMVSSKPPCEIAIDGVATVLMTPQRALKLEAGKHKVTLFNLQYDIDETFDIVIAPKQATKLIHDFTPQLKRRR